jgi:ribosome maturation factor RimP
MQHVDIQAIITPIIEGMGYECCGVKRSGSGRDAALCVYVDKTGGITIDELAKVSRQIQSELRVVGVDIDNMRLEVSSPGKKKDEASDG